MISLLAFVFAVCSATAWYAASPHCRWSALRGRPRLVRGAGIALALLSLLGWTNGFGIGSGLCAMLASMMLALIVQPWLALVIGSPDADVVPPEQD